MEVNHETFDFIIAELKLIRSLLKDRRSITDLVTNLSQEEVARIWGLAEVCQDVSDNFERICKCPADKI